MKGLIEHKIIRRQGKRTEARDFIRPRRFVSKRLFSGPLLGIEPRQGNNYQDRVTLIQKSCYRDPLLHLVPSALLFLRRQTSSLNRVGPPSIIAADDLLELHIPRYRNSATSVPIAKSLPLPHRLPAR